MMRDVPLIIHNTRLRQFQVPAGLQPGTLLSGLNDDDDGPGHGSISKGTPP
jgi:hypothetical protein